MSNELDPLLLALSDAKVNTARPIIRLATITGTSPLRVQFDGEAGASLKTYKRMSSYSPTTNHRVLMVRAGRSWVVVGQVVT